MSRLPHRASQGIGWRISQLRGERSRRIFAQLLGVSERTLIRLEKEERLPDAEVLARLCQTCDADPAWLLLGQPQIDRNYVYIPRYDLEISAGPGAFSDLVAEPEVIALDHDWLRHELGVAPETVSMVRVTGDSMEPTLLHGDVVLVTTEFALSPFREGVYVVRYGDLLQVKRVLTPRRQQWLITSDNPVYPPYHLTGSEEGFAVLGRVIWIGRRCAWGGRSP